VVIFLIVRSKRKRDAERTNGKVRTGPAKLTLSIPAPVSPQGLPGHGPGSLPPAQAGPHKRTEETGDGSGYIRPARPKKDKRKQKGPAGPDDDQDILDDRTPSVLLEQTPTDRSAQPIPTEMDGDSFQVPEAKAPRDPEAPEGPTDHRPPQKEGQPGDGQGVFEAQDEEVEIPDELEEIEELDEVDEADQEDIEEWTA